MYKGKDVYVHPHKRELHGHRCGCTWACVWVYVGMDESIYGHRHVCLLVFCLLTISVVDGMRTFSETIALKIDLVNLVFGETNVLK